MSVADDPILTATMRHRDDLYREMQKLTNGAVRAKRGLTAVEEARFNELEAQLTEDDEIIATRSAERDRRVTAALALAEYSPDRRSGVAYVTSSPMTYDKGGQYSMLADMATLACSHLDASAGSRASEAHERLAQHRREVDIEARTNTALARSLEEQRLAPRELRVNPNTTAGTGGELVPPLWLVTQYVPYQRPSRVISNRVNSMPLPTGTNVVNIPRIKTASLTGVQTAEATPIASRDMTTDAIAAKVITIAGQEDISLQLLEQSPLAMDGVIFQDLTDDYDMQLDQQLIYGTGANGQHKGVMSLSAQTSNTDRFHANAITVSSATFDGSAAGGQYRSIANGINAVHTNRFKPATAIWCHPRRASSWTFAVDTVNRPLYRAYSAYNSYGASVSGDVDQGVHGELAGLPVIVDANMPTTMSGTATTGGTADPIIVTREQDHWLFEGQIRLRALPEILSGTLQVRFQAFSYSAFTAERLPAATSILTGDTGLASPTY